MKKNNKAKMLITNLCKQAFGNYMNGYRICYITFELRTFSFVEVKIVGWDRNFNSYVYTSITDVPYFKLAELFDTIKMQSDIPNKENFILYPLKCEMHFDENNLFYVCNIDFVSRDTIEDDDEVFRRHETWDNKKIQL